MSVLKTGCFAVFATIFSMNADAAIISTIPSSQNVSLGNLFSINLVISGLSSGTAPSVGTFDLDLFFDPLLLSFVSGTFGNQLDILGLGSLQTISPGFGTVNFFELSLDTIDDLNNLQADSFILATLTFDTLVVGTSSLTLNVNALGDAEGAHR